MKIKVVVKPKSRQNKIEQGEDFLTVYLNALPESGKANKLLLEILADYFSVPKTLIKIINGESSRIKIIEVNKDV